MKSNSPRLIDLTAPLGERMPVYPGDPPFHREWHSTLVRDGYNVSLLSMGSHIGTHVDAPLHFATVGQDIGSMSLGRFFGAAVAVDAPRAPGENVELEDLKDAGLRDGDIVLLRTGWEARAGTSCYFEGEYPGVSPDAVEFLIEHGIKALGGDFPSVDSPASVAAGAPAHKLLAAAGVPVFEGLVGLSQVVGKRFLFAGFPLRIEGCDASPVRAVAIMGIVS